MGAKSADPNTPHEECLATLRSVLEAAQRSAVQDLALPGELLGHVIVSTVRVVAPGLSEESVVCPHGVRYWYAPDAEMQQSMRTLVDEV